MTDDPAKAPRPSRRPRATASSRRPRATASSPTKPRPKQRLKPPAEEIQSSPELPPIEAVVEAMESSPELPPIEAVVEAMESSPELPPAESVVDESSSIETDRPTGISLYLLRHADAGDPMAWTGDDAARPLSKKGRRQSKRLGRLLADLDVRPDVILTSPKVRSAETAKLVGRLVGRKPATDDRLALDFGGAALAGLVAGLGEEVQSVMLVGHDPDFSTTLSWLVGGSLTLRKGALAVVVLPDGEPAAGRGSLRWLLPPDAIPG